MINRYIHAFRIVLVFLLVLYTNCALSADFYVKLDGSGAKDGSNWANAMGREAFSLKLLNSTAPGDIFHLAAGIYHPWHNLLGEANVSNTTKTFLIKSGVSIIGGYSADPVNGEAVETDSSRVVLSGAFANGIYSKSVVTIASGALNVTINILTITGGRGGSSGGGVLVNTNAKLTMSHVHIKDNQALSRGGAIHVDAGADMSLLKSDIEANTSNDRGGAINLYKAKAYLNDVKITLNKAATWGGGMHIEESTCIINDSYFEENKADHGGAIHNTKATLVTITDTEMSKNTTTNQGGAIDSYYNSTMSLTRVIFKDNTSATWGGAIHNDGSKLDAVSCKFLRNKAVHGGAFHNSHANAIATISKSIFAENEGNDGGAIANYDRTLTLEYCDIYDNIATGIGGAGIHNEVGALFVRSCLIRGNKATHSNASGGGIFSQTGTVTLSNSTITNNTSAYQGGGLYCRGTVNVISSTIVNNIATNSGGGVYNAGITTLRNNIISANSTDLNGSAFSTNSKYNIIGSGYYLAGTTTGNLLTPFNTSLHLGPLANNGGLTHTYMLTGVSSSNIAMEGGDPSVTNDSDAQLHYDQLGELRTAPVSIGAVEYSNPALLLKANNDTIQLFVNSSSLVNQLANDNIPAATVCDILGIEISVFPAVGATATLNAQKITYTPPPNFVGTDSLSYKIECSGSLGVTSTAKIFFKVIPKPDNISDAQCVGTPSAINWSFAELMTSPATSPIDNASISLVGDIDNDGKIEIIAFSKAVDIQYVNEIHIFEVDNNNLVLQQTLSGLPYINTLLIFHYNQLINS